MTSPSSSLRRFRLALLLPAAILWGAGFAGCGEDAASPGPPAGSAGAAGAAGGAAGRGGNGVAGSVSGGAAGAAGAPAVVLHDCSEPVPNAAQKFRLASVATGLSEPVLAIASPDDASRLFVVEQTGGIRVIRDGALLPEPFLTIAPLRSGGEQGFLGLAFHPEYAANGRLFVHYSDSAGNTVVEERHRGADADHADPAFKATVFQQEQPQANHNGGMLAFGSDGMLYLGLGDGGGADDQHPAPFGNGQGQRTSTALGKILRFDVSQAPYAIPAGNLTGAGVKGEIWDYGLRNPWRFSFDVCTGDLYIGDVGQNQWEEIDIEPKGSGGRNYGWRVMEGTHCVHPDDGVPCDDPSFTAPAFDYGHVPGTTGIQRCSVTGGYVYRGKSLPSLRGGYIFGDFCSKEIWVLRAASGKTEVAPLALDDNPIQAGIASFGTDLAGEVYVVDKGGTIFRVEAEAKPLFVAVARAWGGARATWTQCGRRRALERTYGVTCQSPREGIGEASRGTIQKHAAPAKDGTGARKSTAAVPFKSSGASRKSDTGWAFPQVTP